MATIGVVGLGAMGRRLAARLLGAGHEVLVWNRTHSAASDLEAAGARALESPAAVAAAAEAVLTMVADPAALVAVTEGPDGVCAGIEAPSTLIEMSTVGPAAVLRLARALPEGAGLLDAPVLGSISEAEAGTLHLFVGGDDELFARRAALLATFGTPLHVGPQGSGAGAKLVANLTLLGVLGVLGEALALADALGLPRPAAFEVLAATPLAQQAARRRPALEAADFAPRFRLALAHKDAELVGSAARDAGADLRLAEAVRTWLADAERGGLGDLDYSAVLALIAGRGV